MRLMRITSWSFLCPNPLMRKVKTVVDRYPTRVEYALRMFNIGWYRDDSSLSNLTGTGLFCDIRQY